MSGTIGVAIVGAGDVTKTGPGTVILTAANTYTGGTTISGGTLQLGNGGTTGSIVGNITDNGVLEFNRTDAAPEFERQHHRHRQRGSSRHGHGDIVGHQHL